MDEFFDGEINWLKSFKLILKGGSKYFVIDELFLFVLGVKVYVNVDFKILIIYQKDMVSGIYEFFYEFNVVYQLLFKELR